MADKKPGKYDIKPYDAPNMQFDIVTADDAGNAQYLHPDQEHAVRELINSMAPEQVPTNGLIFVPEKKYKEIQAEINRGYLFGNPISTGNEENFRIGGDLLGNGFSLPQHRRTYVNAAVLNDPKELEHVLSHEFGHNAAWLSNPKRADLSEEGADNFAEAYAKRGQQTRKNWEQIKHERVNGVLSGVLDALSGASIGPPRTTQAVLSGEK